METTHTKYLGELRTHITHMASGTEILTDAPVDNHGRGEAFSPTDMLATSLTSCMLTIMAIAAETYKFSMEGVTAKTTKVMLDNPRRVGTVKIELFFPHNQYDQKQKTVIEYASKNCPVALSLHPEIKQEVIIHYAEK
ncbi:MAG: OsmC family protein [Bacteroidota bacterium]